MWLAQCPANLLPSVECNGLLADSGYMFEVLDGLSEVSSTLSRGSRGAAIALPTGVTGSDVSEVSVKCLWGT